MFDARALSLAAAVAALASTVPTVADAQVRSPYATQLRQDEAREEAREGRRLELVEVLRRVEAGRPGRMLPGGVQARPEVYIIQWEYPGGRVVSITVDARTGRIISER
ncbi:hypothetical protein [Brevundimonas balnearis]|uniref:PepSY domain-containing protein n=1 Tax=Brevundimonas balnearis TaxID=1572858 RepID=A0ABV6R1C5_9CAUL